MMAGEVEEWCVGKNDALRNYWAPAYRSVLFGCGFFGLCFKERERECKNRGWGGAERILSRLHAQHGVHQWGLIS